ncbi:hypothetical protein [Streptomyces griseoluteus]|uniref:hypothetical protein n=1 Tax=Streptomyces griseoluteus TaxID=29306 RepID=UPI0036F8D441
MTRKFAIACGADPEVLRTVWESERLRHKGGAPLPANAEPEAAQSAEERLCAAIHTLLAGRPAPVDIAAASHWRLSAGTAAIVLEATTLPDPDMLDTFVHVLGGDRDRFGELLRDALQETAQNTAAPPEPAPATLPAHGPHAVMKAFSKTLTADEAVKDGRARLLQHAARQNTQLPRARLTRPQPIA